MVARINTSKNITRALQYNEQKVGQGKAECIYAHNFLKDANQLSFGEKLHHFHQFLSLNESTRTNTLHVSINFHPKEQVTDEKLIEIAGAYMRQIRFGEQPFLVYRHWDAGHPHMHIVSTNIKRDGSRISIHNLGRLHSEQARKQIEIEFGLIRAGSKEHQQKAQIPPASTQKVVYGKVATQEAITGVLHYVLHQYKYTNLSELNALLSLYGVAADPGKEGGRIYKHRGLTYRILNEKGQKMGVPIKASTLSFKPTLSYIEQRFTVNLQQREAQKQRLKTTVDWEFLKHHHSLSTLIKALEKEGVSMVLQQSKGGIIQSLTYVDHRSKWVVQGSELGAAYAEKGLQERCKQKEQEKQGFNNKIIRQSTIKEKVPETAIKEAAPSYIDKMATPLPKAIEEVVQPVSTNNTLPVELKKKKRKRISHHF